MNKLKKRILSFVTAAAVAFAGLVTVPDAQLLSAEAQAASKTKYIVALGDSYTAGEGIEPFVGQFTKKGKETSDSKKVKNSGWLAHRSTLAWSGMLKLDGKYKVVSAAASGAEIKHLTEPQEKAYKFNKQVGKASLDPQLSVFDGIKGEVSCVVLTLGGNDMDFAGIMGAALTKSEKDLRKLLNGKLKEFDKRISAELEAAYKAIAEKAGGAAIIVAGYPTLMSEDGFSYAGFVNVSAEKAKVVNESVHKLNSRIKKLVKKCAEDGMNISFVSVEKAFKGHEAYTEDPYINEIIYQGDTQDLVRPVSMLAPSAYSIHPNEKGAKAYAKAVQKAIDKLGL